MSVAPVEVANGYSVAVLVGRLALEGGGQGKEALYKAERFGSNYWPAEGGGMICSASQDWKLSSDSTICTQPQFIA